MDKATKRLMALFFAGRDLIQLCCGYPESVWAELGDIGRTIDPARICLNFSSLISHNWGVLGVQTSLGRINRFDGFSSALD